MIFITVGTEQFPFDRLLRIMDDAVRRGEIRQKVFAQIGAARYEPAFFSWCRFLPYEEMAERILRAEIIVSHAGVGSFLMCLEMGKTPILFPRRVEFGEHVDDHQMEFMEKMVYEGKILWARDEKELLSHIRRFPEIVRRFEERKTLPRGKSLIEYLKQVVEV
jgi:UDP-N-acetylglucosamine transferase subunit ALG13